MTTQTSNNTSNGMVQAMRAIREEFSGEIKDMTFEEERAYLDKLLADKKKVSFNAISIDTKGFKFERNEVNER